MNEEQEAFLQRKIEEVGPVNYLLSGGVFPLDEHGRLTKGVSTLSLDREDRELLQSLKVVSSTQQSSEIIRTLSFCLWRRSRALGRRISLRNIETFALCLDVHYGRCERSGGNLEEDSSGRPA